MAPGTGVTTYHGSREAYDWSAAHSLGCFSVLPHPCATVNGHDNGIVTRGSGTSGMKL